MDVRLNVYAEVLDVLADAPDLVLVATGGIPDFAPWRGSELCLSVFRRSWDPVQIAMTCDL